MRIRTILVLSIALTWGLPASAQFVRGDANGDGTVDIGDVVGILNQLFVPGTPLPDCHAAHDANDSGTIDVSDAIFVASYLFSSGATLPPPFPDPGFDPTPDSLPSCGGTGTPVPLDLLQAGTYSGAIPPCQLDLYVEVIDDESSWLAFWSVHSIQLPPPPAPAIDFGLYDVLVVMHGGTSGGFGISTDSVLDFGDHLEVEVTLTNPMGCISLAVCTAPHQLWLIPAGGPTDVTATITEVFPCL